MNILLVIVIPLVLILLLNMFRALIGKFERLEFAMDLHLSGLILMLPLPLTTPGMAEALLYTTVFSATALILTAACYMICILNPKKTFYERIGLGIGASFFLLGVVLAACLLK